ncbi:anhydro-N-acetylmuramic acid kinase [Comamonadaceae bacterium M7527]|nr:anhydro-N-acetylmuramic acid kinase [Comamonadaceae bacterium M7527]
MTTATRHAPTPHNNGLFIGLMSGTSLDGVDGVLCRIDQDGQPYVMAHAHQAFSPAVKCLALQLNTAGHNELALAAQLANSLSHINAGVCEQLLAYANLNASDIQAVASHGQTVRHAPHAAPNLDGLNSVGYSLQVNNPALLAELTGIDVIADFRSRDIAANGQGAPLVPAFHQHVFARNNETVAVLNIGGMANVSVLAPTGVWGCDTGPGNVLLDTWVHQQLGQAFDADGAWGASGSVHSDLLHALLQEPFFATNQTASPTSTGRDLFNAQWLAQRLKGFTHVAAADVQATLGALTAHSAAQQIQLISTQATPPGSVLVCGGGAYNKQLMAQLRLAMPHATVHTTDEVGMPALHVEACAFAWLAWCFTQRRPGNVVAATGALGPRVLGALYPA